MPSNSADIDMNMNTSPIDDESLDYDADEGLDNDFDEGLVNDSASCIASMRLQKYLSRCGVASRRNSEQLIREGHISINGIIVTDMGIKVTENDVIALDGKLLSLPHETCTIMLHKPAGYVTTMEDPQGRPCIKDLIPVTDYPGLYHIGRLDRDTSGLLLLSTDGDLGNGLLHPSKEVFKTYFAQVEGKLTIEQINDLCMGVMLDDGITAPALVEQLNNEVEENALAIIEGSGQIGASGRNQRHGGKRAYGRVKKNSSIVKITIHEGRNRQVRRMMEYVGHPVIALHRQTFAELDLGNLPRGEYRVLNEKEIEILKGHIQRNHENEVKK